MIKCIKDNITISKDIFSASLCNMLIPEQHSQCSPKRAIPLVPGVHTLAHVGDAFVA